MAADYSEEQFKGYLKESKPVAHRIVESLEQDLKILRCYEQSTLVHVCKYIYLLVAF
jgi:hypothetical protein